jgi:hypothetical protein
MKPEPWLSTSKALDRIRNTMADVRPLRDWLRTKANSIEG